MEAIAVKGPGKHRKRRRFKWKRLIFLFVFLAAAAALVYWFMNREDPTAVDNLTQYPVEYRDLTVKVNVTGTIDVKNSEEVYSTVAGDVIKSNFKEGDNVRKGDVLYIIDSSDVENNISQLQSNVTSAELAVEQAGLSLSGANRSYDNLSDAYDDLVLYSKVSGQVTEVFFKTGDTVTAGATVATVTDSDTMVLKVPFHSADAENIQSGEPATVTISHTGEQLSGTVTEVSKIVTPGSGGTVTRTVSISVSNPGGIASGSSATAQCGEYSCADNGTFEYNEDSVIYAEQTGKISGIYINEGDWINEGNTVLMLDSKDIDDQKSVLDDNISSASLNLKSAENSLASARNSLNNAYGALDDYTITSPITGTIVDMPIEAGDTISTRNIASPMMTIYDLSEMRCVVNIDELDISQIRKGQSATITADALEGQEFSGEVTRIGITPNTYNGITSYPVRITISHSGSLLPGMNINCDILVEEVENVLTIPVSAVTRGNTVLVYDELSEGDPSDGTPAGYRRVQVEVGRSDDDYIEILSGLNENDIVGVDTSDVTDIMSSMMTAMG